MKINKIILSNLLIFLTKYISAMNRNEAITEMATSNLIFSAGYQYKERYNNWSKAAIMIIKMLLTMDFIY